MRSGEIFSKAWQDTEPFLKLGWKLSVLVCPSAVSVPLGFLAQRDNESMTGLGVIVVYGLGSFVVAMVLLLLWNLWLAPHRLIEERMLEWIRKSTRPSIPVQDSALEAVPETADPAAWKHVPEFQIWEVADICGGISPTDPDERENDASRAMFTQLTRAVKAGILRPIDDPWVHSVRFRRVKREELKRYFTDLGDVPEFLR